MPTQSSFAIRLPNWVGDVVMALPALQALSESGVELHLLGRRWILDLLAATPYKLYPLPGAVIEGSRYLRTFPHDKIVLLPPSLSSALMARLAGKESIGYRGELRGLFLSKSLAEPKGLHVVESYWNLLCTANQCWLPETTLGALPKKVVLPLNQTQKDSARQILQDHAIQSPYWVLCPTVSGKGLKKESKSWPYWSELASLLVKKGYTVLACPGPNEEAVCRQILPEVKIIPGVDLGKYAAILAGAQQVVANDSGPMHVAAAVGAPLLGIFGVTNPDRTRPWGGTYIGDKHGWPDLSSVLARLPQNF